MYYKTIQILALLFLLLVFVQCKDSSKNCPPEDEVLESFVTSDGINYFITSNGEGYFREENGCVFIEQYFDPNFADVYVFTDSGIYIQTDDGALFETENSFFENFESYFIFTDVIAQSTSDTNLNFNSFVLQSPLAQTVEEYVALRTCILNNTCTFLDNRIDLVSDPNDAENQVMQFTSVAPTENMVTAKCSMERSFNYFVSGMDIWYEADYYIQSGLPYSLVDFENDYFSEGPGPRVVILDGNLAVENKFGEKIKYIPEVETPVPINTWFTLKVHLYLCSKANGKIELWLNGNLFLSVNGITIPTSNSIQNSLEVGVSATDIGSVLLMDNIQLSNVPF